MARKEWTAHCLRPDGGHSGCPSEDVKNVDHLGAVQWGSRVPETENRWGGTPAREGGQSVSTGDFSQRHGAGKLSWRSLGTLPEPCAASALPTLRSTLGDQSTRPSRGFVLRGE